MPDEPMQETARTVEWDDLTPEQQAEVERKRAGREATTRTVRLSQRDRASLAHVLLSAAEAAAAKRPTPPARETTS